MGHHTNDVAAQKGIICSFFFLPVSKLIILVDAEFNFILSLLRFYQVNMLLKNKFQKFVETISSYNSHYVD